MNRLPLLMLTLIVSVLLLFQTIPQASAELSASLTIDPKKDDPGLYSIKHVAFDGKHIVIGTETGEYVQYLGRKGRIMVYDTSGSLISQFEASPDVIYTDGNIILSLNGNTVYLYDMQGTIVKKISTSRFGRVSGGGSHSGDTALLSDGEYVYLYEVNGGTVRKISKNSVLVAEYHFSRDGGPLVLRGGEIWVTDPYLAKKTVVLDMSLKPVREISASAEDMAAYDDMIVTSDFNDLTVRDADLKTISKVNPMPSGWILIDMDVADGKAVVAGMIKTQNHTATTPAVYDYKVYVYDLAQVVPRGKPIQSPAPEPYVMGEAPATEFVKTYDGVSFVSMAGAVDGYVLAGTIGSGVSSGTKAYVVKTDLAGNKIWDQTLEQYRNTYAQSIKALPDGGYLLVGYVAGDKGEDSYAAKLGADGSVIWESKFDTAGDDRLHDLAPASNGTYVAVGRLADKVGSYTSMYLAWISADGSLQSSKTYGNTSPEGYRTGNAITIAKDGDIMAAGMAHTKLGNQTYVAKIGPDGSLRWEQWYSLGLPATYGSDIVETSDGGFAVAGNAMMPAGSGSFTIDKSAYTINYDGFLIKTDRSGNLEWYRLYDGVYKDGNSNNDVNVLWQTVDGGFLLVGKSMAPASEEESWLKTPYVAMIIKTDNRGCVQWRKYAGDGGATQGNAVLVGEDGSYAIAGDAGSGSDAAGYLMKLKSEHLTPTVQATPTAAVATTPAGTAPTTGKGSTGGLCTAAILPLLLVCGVMIGRIWHVRR